MVFKRKEKQLGPINSPIQEPGCTAPSGYFHTWTWPVSALSNNKAATSLVDHSNTMEGVRPGTNAASSTEDTGAGESVSGHIGIAESQEGGGCVK
jgi:hypothetical protein